MQELIILGAGASVDFNFPSGLGLLRMIHSLWGAPDKVYQEFYLHAAKAHNRIYGYEMNSQTAVDKIKYLSNRLFYSSAESIDDFLSQCSDKVEIDFGKLTILNLILKSESESKEMIGNKSLFRWERNWLRIFFGRRFIRLKNADELEADLKTNKVNFIIFNYDRSVEYFLFQAIRNYYDIPPARVKQILGNISFFHVYGQLAPLEWQVEKEQESLKYGEDFQGIHADHHDKLYQCVPNIKIIDEDRSGSADIKEQCRNLAAQAEKVRILGFGFHKTNYALLGIEELKEEAGGRLPLHKFFYTTFGLSEGQKEFIASQYFGHIAGGDRADSYDLNIYDYVRHHY